MNVMYCSCVLHACLYSLAASYFHGVLFFTSLLNEPNIAFHTLIFTSNYFISIPTKKNLMLRLSIFHTSHNF